MNLEQFFRRPKAYPDIRDARVEMAVKRAVDGGKVKQVKFNYYYRQGWWERIGTSKWTVRDAVTFLALGLGKRIVEGPEEVPTGVDTDPALLRREARFLYKVSEVAQGIADELNRRAELLELEEEKVSETEVTD